jgi:probable HAF family extracellular repeat protein
MRLSRLLLLPLLSAPLLVQAAPVYTVAALGNLPGASYAQPLGINSSGQVVGRSNGAQSTAFLYSGGTMSSLGTLGGPNSEAGGINNAGVVAGSANLADGTSRAFTYAGGVKTPLGTLGGSSSFGYGINNAGTVAGASYLAGDLTYHAVTYSGGAITDLGTLGGAASFGRVINDAGAVAGWSTNSSGDGRAFVSVGGVMNDLGTLGGTASDAWGINANGAVVGASWIAGDLYSHAFLYSGGVMVDLGTLGAQQSAAYGINSAGSVVGGLTYSSGLQHGFVYSGGVMTDLNTLIDPALGLTITYASVINDLGQIAGEACNIRIECQAVLLSLDAVTPDPTAVPEPASFPAVLAALGLVGMMRRRKSRARK